MTASQASGPPHGRSSSALNSELREFILALRPMLDDGISRLTDDTSNAFKRLRYERALSLCRTIEVCTDELPQDVIDDAKRLLLFVVSQCDTREKVN